MTTKPPPPDSVRPKLVREWMLLLAGPTIWATHFMSVYLLTEAVCATNPSDEGSTSVVSIAVLVLTVLGVVGSGWAARRSSIVLRTTGESEDVSRFFALLGVMLGLVFAVSIAFVGLPALALPPC